MADLTEKPWDGDAARYPDAKSYCAACLIDDNAPGGDKIKDNCHLPVREPDGTLNSNALGPAAAALAGARGGIKASPEDKKSAAKKLLGLYRQAKQEPPVSLKRIAGVPA